jgi:hypothetical protein
MSIQSDRGARHERRTAAALGGRRIGNTGRASADAVSDWLAIECKARLQLPAWLTGAVKQAVTAAAAYTSARLPVAVLHQVGGRAADDLMVMRRADFVAWFGSWRRGDGWGHDGEAA